MSDNAAMKAPSHAKGLVPAQPMAPLPPKPAVVTSSRTKAGSLEEDFLHGVHVANSAISVRMGFLRKVYAILTVQMIVTTAVCALFMWSPSLAEAARTNNVLRIFMTLLTFATLFATMYNRHTTPLNFYLLGGFTLAMSFSVGTLVSVYETASVLQAAAITGSVFLGLTLYAMQTKYDFTPLFGSLVAVLWVFVVASIVRVLFPPDDAVEYGMSMVGAALFSVFVIVDTQRMMYRLSVDEYILCAIDLYLDIVNLFIEILKLTGKRK